MLFAFVFFSLWFAHFAPVRISWTAQEEQVGVCPGPQKSTSGEAEGITRPPLVSTLPACCVFLCMLSCSVVADSFAPPWTVACQAPLSMEFSRQEYWSGLPFSPPGDLPDPGTEPMSLMSPTLAGGFFTTGATWGPFQYSRSSQWCKPCHFICSLWVSASWLFPLWVRTPTAHCWPVLQDYPLGTLLFVCRDSNHFWAPDTHGFIPWDATNGICQVPVLL